MSSSERRGGNYTPLPSGSPPPPPSREGGREEGGGDEMAIRRRTVAQNIQRFVHRAEGNAFYNLLMTISLVILEGLTYFPTGSENFREETILFLEYFRWAVHLFILGFIGYWLTAYYCCSGGTLQAINRAIETDYQALEICTIQRATEQARQGAVCYIDLRDQLILLTALQETLQNEPRSSRATEESIGATDMRITSTIRRTVRDSSGDELLEEARRVYNSQDIQDLILTDDSIRSEAQKLNELIVEIEVALLSRISPDQIVPELQSLLADLNRYDGDRRGARERGREGEGYPTADIRSPTESFTLRIPNPRDRACEWIRHFESNERLRTAFQENETLRGIVQNIDRLLIFGGRGLDIERTMADEIDLLLKQTQNVEAIDDLDVVLRQISNLLDTDQHPFREPLSPDQRELLSERLQQVTAEKEKRRTRIR